MAQPVGPATLLVYCFLGQFGLIGLNHFLSASSKAPPGPDTAAAAVSAAPPACPSCPEVEGCELFPWLVRVGLAFLLGEFSTYALRKLECFKQANRSALHILKKLECFKQASISSSVTRDAPFEEIKVFQVGMSS